jgi:hypothetical protein
MQDQIVRMRGAMSQSAPEATSRNMPKLVAVLSEGQK